MENIKNGLQFIAIVAFAIFLTSITVSMIAYANCHEAKVFFDNLFFASTSLPQA